MDDMNNNSTHEEEKIEEIISALLTDMIDQVMLMRKEHLKKLNIERVRRYRQRKQHANKSEYMRKVREQKRKHREAYRQKMTS
ncbi:unnamed protein product [Rotaria socialis]|uniref:Uncharacterized protein n=1 Tax=Rotaria socialis TaxID=392032 RepID=A0A818NVQ3_9BILA|nr:unnamed protein product [Rotaria socialis]CAF3468527.1 unnamed protein product [Rotaria socialis]CAF3613082.1 unnamed protein product [Rotaria socialis]CAF4368065.1 unnamed protein product [Rotaria socialis]CAF4478901.1 unnamed protein product [Rotaria socialis]